LLLRHSESRHCEQNDSNLLHDILPKSANMVSSLRPLAGPAPEPGKAFIRAAPRGIIIGREGARFL
jgi:hypothetical protein